MSLGAGGQVVAALSEADWAVLKAALNRVRSGAGHGRGGDLAEACGGAVAGLAVRVRAVTTCGAATHSLVTQREMGASAGGLARRGAPRSGEVVLGGSSIRAYRRAAGAKGARLNVLGRSRGGLGPQGLRDLRCARPCPRLRAAARPRSRTDVPAQRAGPGPAARFLRSGGLHRGLFRSVLASPQRRDQGRARGAHPTIPYDCAASARRHRVEILWGLVPRRGAPCHPAQDATPARLMGALCLAADLDGLRSRP